VKTNTIKRIIILSLIFLVGTVYGILIYKHHAFPYVIIRKIFNKGETQQPVYGPWSIGIYKGNSPFNLTDPEDISNPILTGESITDIDGVFVADPFMVATKEKYFVFFEVINRATGQGDIAYAESANLTIWDYGKVVIDEKFHLSYPYVFQWDGNYYLVPESQKDFSVRLYIATDFPEEWEYIGNILSGYRYVDNSLFRYLDKWWMFVSTGDNNVLNLYYSEDLQGFWKPHPMNPIIKFDKHYSRPAGRVISYCNKLYRMVQDDYPEYGTHVFAFEITELSEESYSEQIVSTQPLLTGTGIGWNAAGMHHVDLHEIGNEWVGAVDGRDR